MVALKIEDLKGFTSKLFVGDVFDQWLLREATITNFNVFTIDGRIRHEYYTKQEMEENSIGRLSPWKTIRPICFSLVKGKKLPGSFHLTFQLSPAGQERFLKEAQLDFPAEQIGGLYLNVRYEDHVMHCVTGTSLNVFTLDKRMEQEWDQAARQFLKGQKIAFTEG